MLQNVSLLEGFSGSQSVPESSLGKGFSDSAREGVHFSLGILRGSFLLKTKKKFYKYSVKKCSFDKIYTQIHFQGRVRLFIQFYKHLKRDDKGKVCIFFHML